MIVGKKENRRQETGDRIKQKNTYAEEYIRLLFEQGAIGHETDGINSKRIIFMKEVSAEKVRDILRKQWPELKYVWVFDRRLSLLLYEDAENILDNLQGSAQRFEYELFDCDDFSLVAHAFVKLKIASERETYKYNWAFGEMMGEQYGVGVHIQNLFITDDEKVFYYEPQLRQIQRPDPHDSAIFVRI